PSGCGKTTLLRMIAGLEHPSAGEIYIAGRRVDQDVPPRDRGIAMVFQSYALYPHRTVSGNIAFPLEAAHLPRAVIAEKVRWAAGGHAAPGLRGSGRYLCRDVSGPAPDEPCSATGRRRRRDPARISARAPAPARAFRRPGAASPHSAHRSTGGVPGLGSVCVWDGGV